MQQDAIVRVLIRERARLLAYARAIVANIHTAEDVLQDISAAAVSKADEITDEPHLQRWLQRAARLRSIDALRRDAVRPRALDNAAVDRLEAAWREDGGPLAERLDALHACVGRLTPHAQRLVELRYGQGLSGEALGRILERPVNTIYVALSRIHLRLRACIRARIGDPQ